MMTFSIIGFLEFFVMFFFVPFLAAVIAFIFIKIFGLDK